LFADHNGAFNALLRTWLGDAQSTRLESAGSIDGVKRGIAESDMIGVLPDYAVTKEISARTLVALKLREPLPPVALRLTTREAPRAGSPLDGLIAQIGTALAPLHAGPR
jgi:DNA-binding transcriptional LysR family regulator